MREGIRPTKPPEEPTFRKGERVLIDESMREVPGGVPESFAYDRSYAVLGTDEEDGWVYLCSNGNITQEDIDTFDPDYYILPKSSPEIAERYGDIAVLRFDEVHRVQ